MVIPFFQIFKLISPEEVVAEARDEVIVRAPISFDSVGCQDVDQITSWPWSLRFLPRKHGKSTTVVV